MPGYGTHKDLSARANKKLLADIGAQYDGLFETPEATAKKWVEWWTARAGAGGIEERRYYEKGLAAMKRLLEATATQEPLPETLTLWRQIGDTAYYGKHHNPPVLSKRTKFAKPGATDIAAIMQAEFVKGVYVSTDFPNKLHIITAPRTIDRGDYKYQMGTFRLVLDLTYMPSAPGGTIRIIAHNARCYGNVIHPHAYQTGGCCFGQAGKPIRTHLQTGLLYEAVSLICQLLNTHNHGGYADAQHWKKGVTYTRAWCAFGDHKATGRYSTCNHCGARHCETCRKKEPKKDGKYSCLFCGLALPKTKRAKAKKRKPKKTGKG